MNPDNHETSRDTKGRWVKGMSGNVFGRPKGKTMKEWAREYLERMTDEERDDFMDGIPKEIIWKMSEGNPQTNTDLTSKGEKLETSTDIDAIAKGVAEKLRESKINDEPTAQ